MINENSEAQASVPKSPQYHILKEILPDPRPTPIPQNLEPINELTVFLDG